MTPTVLPAILSFGKSSSNCTVFNKQIVLAPGTILEDYIRNSNSNEILASLMRNEPILLPNARLFSVKFRDTKTDLKPFQVHEVQLLTGVFCTEIFELLGAVIHDFLDNVTHYLKSYFLVLKISGSETLSVERIFSNYLRESKLQVLDDVLTVSTPFNSEALYSTVHIAKIANLKEQTLFVLSSALPTDCEGCPVFNSKLKIIGIVLFSTLKKNNENFKLTCAVNILAIIKSLLRNQNPKLVETVKTPTKKINHYLTKSLVKIHAKNLQGTGVLVSVQNKPYILTCSHVLDGFKKDDLIDCQTVQSTLKARLIWRNEKFEDPFDLAILEPQTALSHRLSSEISTKCYVGQQVFAAGFPFYATDDEFNPSVYEGHVTRYNRYVLQHDATVQSGQSGGPLFDGSGRVLGICVSNLKCDDEIHPQMCFSIPLAVVKKKLEIFNKSRDSTEFDELGNVSRDVKYSWNVEAKL